MQEDNIYVKLNKVLNYIEENIDCEISNVSLAKILGTNEYTFQGIFSLLTNVSIGEYIRNRRLTLAAVDLLKGDKIIDVAVKYNYDSATSFSRAFKKFHNSKPSDITHRVNLRNYPPFSFEEHQVNIDEIKYRYESIESLTLYGVKRRMMCEEIKDYSPEFWNETEKLYPELTSNSPTFSVIEYADGFREKGCYYWIASKQENAKLESVTVRNSNFIVFKIDSLDYKKIADISKQAYLTYVPAINKEILDTISLEIYYEDCIEVWMPIAN